MDAKTYKEVLAASGEAGPAPRSKWILVESRGSHEDTVRIRADHVSVIRCGFQGEKPNVYAVMVSTLSADDVWEFATREEAEAFARVLHGEIEARS